jgi:hypothetical protein
MQSSTQLLKLFMSVGLDTDAIGVNCQKLPFNIKKITNGRKIYFYGSFYDAIYISDTDMNPILVSNKLQSIKREYFANAIKIHVTIHRKTNFNKDDLICICRVEYRKRRTVVRTYHLTVHPYVIYEYVQKCRM